MDGVAPLLAWRRAKAGAVHHTRERVELPEAVIARIAETERRLDALESQMQALMQHLETAAGGAT